jgi:Rrf2 family protein
MIDMATHAEAGPIALREVAERQEVSESYLEQVFAILRKAGLVTAQRGAQGGYELGRPAGGITVGDILRALEGPIAPVQCVEHANVRRCKREDQCPTRPFWQGLKEQIDKYLDKTTLEELAAKSKTTI